MRPIQNQTDQRHLLKIFTWKIYLITKWNCTLHWLWLHTANIVLRQGHSGPPFRSRLKIVKVEILWLEDKVGGSQPCSEAALMEPSYYEPARPATWTRRLATIWRVLYSTIRLISLFSAKHASGSRLLYDIDPTKKTN